MKSNKQQIFALGLISLLALASCKKENEEKLIEVQQTHISKEEELSIEQLKKYISKLLRIQSSNINYDDKREKFLLPKGIEMDKEQAERLYIETPVLNYKNGREVDTEINN